MGFYSVWLYRYELKLLNSEEILGSRVWMHAMATLWSRIRGRLRCVRKPVCVYLHRKEDWMWGTEEVIVPNAGIWEPGIQGMAWCTSLALGKSAHKKKGAGERRSHGNFSRCLNTTWESPLLTLCNSASCFVFARIQLNTNSRCCSKLSLSLSRHFWELFTETKLKNTVHTLARNHFHSLWSAVV